MSASPYQTSTPAPCLGEHNDLVYRDLLGLSPEEYAAHQADGVISTLGSVHSRGNGVCSNSPT